MYFMMPMSISIQRNPTPSWNCLPWMMNLPIFRSWKGCKKVCLGRWTVAPLSPSPIRSISRIVRSNQVQDQLQEKKFVGPGPGNRIPNLGQVTAKRVLANGLVSNTKFQGADVRKPLLAVSGLNDKGNPVWFDHDQTGGSFIIPKNSPELADIRKLIQKIKARVRLDRKGGVFQLRNWTVGSSSKGFHRRVNP